MKKAFLSVLMLLAIICVSSAAYAAIVSRHLSGSATTNADSKASTGYSFSMTDFAQTSDVHIVDEENPLRASELAILIKKDPIKLFELKEIIELFHESNDHEDSVYSLLIWLSVIKSINEEHLRNGLDFLISTGDHTDSSIKNEIEAFTALLDGEVPENIGTRVNQDGMKVIIPENPEALMIPWYASIGNHDAEWMGSFNSDGIVALLVKLLGYQVNPLDIAGLDYVYDVYANSSSGSLTNPAGHGFADIKTNGYYSFNPSPFVHCIVLNTAYFYGQKYGLPIETVAAGILDKEQFNWMLDEIKNNQDKLCIIYSHHSPDRFRELNKNLMKYYVKGADFKAELIKHSNVIAHVVGHTHRNTIIPVTDGLKGYWEITTCSTHSYPQEWRKLSVLDNGDGTGIISTRMFGHDPVYTISEDPRYPAGTDTMMLALFDSGSTNGAGKEADRDTELYFTMPVKVAQNIKANYVPPVTPEGNNDSPQNLDGSSSESDSSSSYCFITAASL